MSIDVRRRTHGPRRYCFSGRTGLGQGRAAVAKNASQATLFHDKAFGGEGTGLGVPMSHDQHGGRLKVETELGFH